MARRNPGRIALSHYYPGFVPTDISANSNFPWWLKFLSKWVLYPLTRPFWVPLEESGHRVLFMASPTRFPARKDTGSYNGKTAAGGSIDGLEVAEGMDGKVGSGAYRVSKYGDTYPKEKLYSKLRENGVAEKVYQHTMTVFREIETGGRFKG
ncbi:hypothetical protein F4677DRAFT_358331 [Hypoxylon crocopeplum]|nr:hypothetical protein F4677DRAFT_358331 [Hypoxylon crocopeplum]